VQELPGCTDVSATMICTHALDKDGRRVTGPLDAS
jgi:hypothetical protein